MEGKQSNPFGVTSDLDVCCEPQHTSKDEKFSPFPKTNETDRRRAKSLPVYLDPPSTFRECHERGKRVQFADTVGLNLASVRHFDDKADDMNETCNVSGLQSGPLQHASYFTSALNFARLVPAFISSDEVDLKSQRVGIALESVTTGSEVKGLIRVMRSNARKQVGIRYTLNNWLTFSDIQAAPVLDKEHVIQWEKFQFILHAPPSFDKDDSVHFAVYCLTDHGEFWDNNNGQNYTLRIQIT